VDIKMGNEEVKEFKLNYLPDFTKDGDILEYTIKIIEDDEVIAGEFVYIQLKSRVILTLEPSMELFSNLSSIRVTVENTSPSEFKGNLESVAPEGWEVDGKLPVTLAPSEKRTYELPIIKKTPKPFNEYEFGFILKDDSGTAIINSKRLLDFQVIVQNTGTISLDGFDGDISDWSNAYPIHLGVPENYESPDDLRNADVAARAFMKWDNDYYYVLVDVYDDNFTQNFDGNQIWRNDSVQVAFDSFAKALYKGYDDDDNAYTFSLTKDKKLLTYCGWRALVDGVKVPAGPVSGDWFRVIRNNEKRITRYLIKIPAKELSPMVFKENSQFKFNIAVNDSDVEDREGYCEYSYGIVVEKDPSSYKTFILKRFEKHEVDLSDSTVELDLK